MNSIVEQIIRGINKGNAFDSHFVIDTIIREHSKPRGQAFGFALPIS